MSLTSPLCFYSSTFAGPRAWVSVSGSVLSFAWKWWPCGRYTALADMALVVVMCVRLPAVQAAWSAGYVAGSALAA